MNKEDFRSQLNDWGQNSVPFLFVADFEMEKPHAWRIDNLDPETIVFDINGFTNSVPTFGSEQIIKFAKTPESFETYRRKFDRVSEHLQYGHTFLINLTTRTPISINSSLRDLFHRVNARYKLQFENFLVFSPETFIQIKGGKIYSYPMKGTIDASLPEAREKILKDVKETAEHITIVDLIRNDLSQVAEQVRVTRFRYVDEIKTNEKSLLQVSSEVQGQLPPDYTSSLGNIITLLLPAGSISGAPKAKTVEIIQKVEEEKRGYYTGVFGYFDGQNLDSGVMIRYIEQSEKRYYYRSGGGITTQSNAQDEYNEMIDKVYVPVY